MKSLLPLAIFFLGSLAAGACSGGESSSNGRTQQPTDGGETSGTSNGSTEGSNGETSNSSVTGSNDNSNNTNSSSDAGTQTTTNTGNNNGMTDVCAGQPDRCIPLCEGGDCSCYCEPAPDVPPACDLKPGSDELCSPNNCFDDDDCMDGAQCYDADCEGEISGRCIAVPEAGRCWSARDCEEGEVCGNRQLCPCGANCFVEDMPGSCVVP